MSVQKPFPFNHPFYSRDLPQTPSTTREPSTDRRKLCINSSWRTHSSRPNLRPLYPVLFLYLFRPLLVPVLFRLFQGRGYLEYQIVPSITYLKMYPIKVSLYHESSYICPPYTNRPDSGLPTLPRSTQSQSPFHQVSSFSPRFWDSVLIRTIPLPRLSSVTPYLTHSLTILQRE